MATNSSGAQKQMISLFWVAITKCPNFEIVFEVVLVEVDETDAPSMEIGKVQVQILDLATIMVKKIKLTLKLFQLCI